MWTQRFYLTGRVAVSAGRFLSCVNTNFMALTVPSLPSLRQSCPTTCSGAGRELSIGCNPTPIGCNLSVFSSVSEVVALISVSLDLIINKLPTRRCCYASSFCHMFCSSAQHGREKKLDIFVAETTRESRSPIQPAQKKTVNPDRYTQCTVVV